MEEQIMSTELYEAAMKGDVSIFINQYGGTRSNEEVDKYFLSYTKEERNNILHVAIAAAQSSSNNEFIEEVLQRFPVLMRQSNSKGDTALHVSARRGSQGITALLMNSQRQPQPQALINSHGNSNDSEGAGAAANAMSGTAESDQPLWMVKNSQGDTPLHAALKRGNTEVALFLINLDDALLGVANHSKEIPLHLAAGFCTGIPGLENRMNRIPRTQESNNQEHLLRIIDVLLRKSSSSSSMRDANDLTPLLRASCCRNCLPVISLILAYNPLLAEQRDLKGRTILHLMKLQRYQEWKRALEIQGINILKDEQDSDGNTPVHLAIKDSDYLKVRVLIECSADFKLKNMDGVSAWDLIQAQDDFLRKLKDKTDEVTNGLMTKELYRAAVDGNMDFLSQHDVIYLVSRSMDGNNILHIAMGPESADQREFVQKVLEKVPILLCQTNAHGDTPLHLAARSRTLGALELMISCKNTFQKAFEMGALCLYFPPWRAKNSVGNTPLHEALLAGNALSARFLIQLDDEVAHYVNNSNETPLHLCTRFKQEAAPLSVAQSTWPEYMALTHVKEFELLLAANMSAVYLRDISGLTPLLRAAQCNQLELVKKLLDYYPRSADIYDFDGRSLLHLLPLNNEREALLDVPQIEALTTAQDYDGNTPLHIAITNRHFRKVKVLVQKCSATDLLLPNHGGESAFDLIRSLNEVPLEIRQLFQRKSPSSQSLYGISEAATKENVNTLLVIAVLLATISFAAAFTVPGGFDQNEGTPIFIRKAAFKVFLISDTCAMCCSMLALFALLWVMTGKTWESLKLIDLSIFVLQMSFYATTIAFMSGVYVATSPKAFWMAILVCVICSILMVLSLKPIILLLSRILPRIPAFLLAIARGSLWIPAIFCSPCTLCCLLTCLRGVGSNVDDEDEEPETKCCCCCRSTTDDIW